MYRRTIKYDLFFLFIVRYFHYAKFETFQMDPCDAPGEPTLIQRHNSIEQLTSSHFLFDLCVALLIDLPRPKTCSIIRSRLLRQPIWAYFCEPHFIHIIISVRQMCIGNGFAKFLFAMGREEK